MTLELELWLENAARGLSDESASKVRAEIQVHHESAREVAIENGASPDEASRMALSVLGDAKTANKQYRRVLLTASETRLLRLGNRKSWGARPFSWSHWLVLAVSLLAILAGGFRLREHDIMAARFWLAFGLGGLFTMLTPRLPVYTPSRARRFRYVEWIVQVGLWVLIFGPGGLDMLWFVVFLICESAWTEWKRAAIRRKLPVADWPLHLYL